jgi:glycosyltransferase involved in cell wall biosynthesis
MILLTHPTGNANARQAALGLHRAGLLGEFWTCLDYRGAGGLARLLPAGVRAQLERRTNPPELAALIRTHPWREAGRLLAAKLPAGALVRHETGPLSVDAVYHSLDRAVARRLRRGAFRGVYAYEDGAAAAFAAAREKGLACIYEQPIGHWRAARTLLGEEAEREPEWAATLTGNRDSDAKNARKDDELAQADVVIAASTFTRQTLEQAGTLRAPVVVVPYGAPTALAGEPDRGAPAGTGPLRVLFVGGLSQRKGLSYLFAAERALRGAVSLTVIGAKPTASCPALDRALATVRWIPGGPHATILAEMRAHDVLVFPSLFEGFGLVLLEAMAMGLPVITTTHTAGPDLITEGVEGHLIPIRSAAAIVERLDALRRDPARRQEMGRRARARAAALTWQVYGARLAEVVGRTLAHR